MGKRVAVIEGHPDANEPHFGSALAEAYASGAAQGGHEVRRIVVAQLDFPVLRDAKDFEEGQPPESIRTAQETIRWANHLVIFFPLWHGDVPAFFKGFLEQVFRPGFALEYAPRAMPKKLLRGKSARIVVTMGMPGVLYRWYFGAHGVKGLKRSVLQFSGVRPVRTTLIGGIGVGSRACTSSAGRRGKHGRSTERRSALRIM